MPGTASEEITLDSHSHPVGRSGLILQTEWEAGGLFKAAQPQASVIWVWAPPTVQVTSPSCVYIELLREIWERGLLWNSSPWEAISVGSGVLLEKFRPDGFSSVEVAPSK